MFFRVKKSSTRKYLQIVENKRFGRKTRQRVIGTIGRMDILSAKGQVDQLLRSLAKYSERALLLLAGASDPQAVVKKVGPALVFERLWERSSIGEVIREYLENRRYQFDVDVKTPKVLAKRLKERFGIDRMCVVSDRGMISQETLTELKKEDIHHILGVRMRKILDITPKVLEGGAYEVVHGQRQSQKDPSPLLVKETTVNGRRYIICENPEEAKADAKARAQILESLKDKLQYGDNALVGSKGYRRYLSAAGKNHFTIDEKKAANDVQYDGKWVLTTDTDLTARETRHSSQSRGRLLWEGLYGRGCRITGNYPNSLITDYQA